MEVQSDEKSLKTDIENQSQFYQKKYGETVPKRAQNGAKMVPTIIKKSSRNLLEF